VALVLDFGAHINTIDSSGGYTALSAAARRGHEEMTRLLLDRGAQLYEQSGARHSLIAAAAVSVAAAAVLHPQHEQATYPQRDPQGAVWIPVTICLPSIATK
jgi:ankyrin repeat protein